MLNAFHPVGDKLEYAPNCGTLVPDQHTLWIDLMTPTRAEELAVEQFIGAELPTRAEMEEIEPSSRLSVANDVLYLTAALPCRAGSNDPGITVVTFVLTDRHLVTVRYDEPGTIPLAIKNVTTALGHTLCEARVLFFHCLGSGSSQASKVRFADIAHLLHFRFYSTS